MEIEPERAAEQADRVRDLGTGPARERRDARRRPAPPRRCTRRIRRRPSWRLRYRAPTSCRWCRRGDWSPRRWCRSTSRTARTRRRTGPRPAAAWCFGMSRKSLRMVTKPLSYLPPCWSRPPAIEQDAGHGDPGREDHHLVDRLASQPDREAMPRRGECRRAGGANGPGRRTAPGVRRAHRKRLTVPGSPRTRPSRPVSTPSTGSTVQSTATKKTAAPM